MPHAGPRRPSRGFGDQPTDLVIGKDVRTPTAPPSWECAGRRYLGVRIQRAEPPRKASTIERRRAHVARWTPLRSHGPLERQGGRDVRSPFTI